MLEERAKTKANVRPFQVPISEFLLDRSPYSVRRRKATHVSSPNIFNRFCGKYTTIQSESHKNCIQSGYLLPRDLVRVVYWTIYISVLFVVQRSVCLDCLRGVGVINLVIYGIILKVCAFM